MSTDIEQLFHELEQRYALLRKESDVIAADRDAWKAKANSCQESSIDLKSNIEDLQKKQSESEFEQKRKDELISSLEKALDSSNLKCFKLSEEAERLRGEIKINVEELVILQARIKETQLNANDSQSQLLPLQFELSRAQQDKQFLEDRLKICESELQKKNKALVEEKSLTSSLKFDLDTKLASLQAELDSYKDRLKSANDQLTIANEKNSSSMEKIRELEKQIASQYELFLQESDGLRRVNDLQKRHLAEATALVSEMEDNLASVKESHARQTSALRQEAQKQIEVLEVALSEVRSQFEGKIKDLENQVANQSTKSSSIIATIADEEDSGKQIVALKSAYGTDIYNLYDRIVSLEKEKIHMQEKRDEAEIYLQHILKDIEQKTPILAEQKRNYSRLIESHSKLSQRYDELVNQVSNLQSALSKTEAARKEALKTSNALEQHNKDLSKQLQHLLKRNLDIQQGRTPTKASVGSINYSSAGDVISEFLVTYDDVEELQLKNAQLLQTIRKLEKDIEESSANADERASEAATNALAAAMKEINSLKEQRQHTEDLVHGLIQQRDMFKAMVQESGSLSKFGTPSSRDLIPIGDIHSTPAPRRESSSASPSRVVQDLQLKLSTSEDEKNKLKDRLLRLEEAERILNDALTSMKAETSKLRMDAAINASDARFNKERVAQLEEALKITSSENAAAMQRRLDIEKIVIEQQQAMRSKEEQLRNSFEQLQATQNLQRQAEKELEISKAAEQRLLTQISTLREEMKRSASLAESVHRIELGLSSKVSEEKALLVTERDAATAALDQLQKQMSEFKSSQEQIISTLKQNLASAQESLNEKTLEVASLKADTSRLQAAVASASERSHLLEKQLALAQERLFASQGVPIVESILEQQLSEQQLALDQATAQITSLKQQLQAAESHAEEYRKLSTSTDSTLKELQQLSATARTNYENEILRLQETVLFLQQEATKSYASTSNLLQEVEDARELHRNSVKALQDSQAEWESRLSAANQAHTQAELQIAQLKSDVVKFQTVAKTSHSNYERELMLHANAEKELRELREQYELQTSLLQNEKNSTVAMTSEIIRKEKALAETQAKLEAEVDEYKKRVSDLEHVNDLLHTQVHNLSGQVDKMLVSRGQQDKQEFETPAPQPSATIPLEAPDIAELQQTVSELREVVRYMKRERDLLSAKLSLADAETARQIDALATAHRSLDDLRAQIATMKEQTNSSTASATSVELARLQQEVLQLPLLRESNSHLRQANEELSVRVTNAEIEVRNLRDSLLPKSEEIRSLQAEKAALLATSQQNIADATYWRERLQVLVSRYHEVDPEEHRLLKEKLEAATSTISAAQTEISDLKSKLATALSDLSIAQSASAALPAKLSELSQLQNTYDALEKSSGILRTKMRELKAKYDEIAAKLTVKTKAEADLTKQLASLQAALDQATAQIAQAVQLTPQVPVAAAFVPPTQIPPVTAPVAVTLPEPAASESAVVPDPAPVTEAETEFSAPQASRKRPFPSDTSQSVPVDANAPKETEPVQSIAAPQQSADEKLQKMKELLQRKKGIGAAKVSSTEPNAPSTSVVSGEEAPMLKKSKPAVEESVDTMEVSAPDSQGPDLAPAPAEPEVIPIKEPVVLAEEAPIIVVKDATPIWGSASKPLSTPSFGQFARGLPVSETAQLGKSIFGVKPISAPTAEEPPVGVEEGQVEEVVAIQEEPKASKNPFIALRPPSPTVSVPIFGKGSLPVPALLTSTAPASSPFKAAPATSTLFGRRPAADSSINVDAPFSAPVESVPANETTTPAVEPTSAEIPSQTTPTGIPKPAAKKVNKTAEPSSLAQKKEQRAQRFNEAAAKASGSTAPAGEGAAPTTPAVKKVLKPRPKPATKSPNTADAVAEPAPQGEQKTE